MSEKKAEAKREGTMVATAKEGEEYLRSVWHHTPDWSKDCPATGTKQGGISSQEDDRSDAKHIDDDNDHEKEELEEQGDTGDTDSSDKGSDEPPLKKIKLPKDNTMVETAKIGKDYLGKEKLEDSRSSTRALRESKGSAKRLSTMVKTAKEGEALLKEMGHKDDSPESSRRRTRSQTRGTPAVPPPQKTTPKHDAPKRSRRGRPRKEEKNEEEEEEEEESENQDIKEGDVNSTDEKKETEEEETPPADSPEDEEKAEN